MRKHISKVVALTLCLVMIASQITPIFAAANYPNTHVNTGNMAADIVAVAVSQAGYCEGSLSGNPAYAGSNNYQKFGQWYDANVDNIGVTYAAWCAAFVSWCANQAGVPSSIVYYHAYCPYGVKWFRNQGRFQYAASRGGSYVPNPGDIVYFAPAGSSTSSHVGIVRYVSGGYVYTVEGNTSGQNGEVNDGGGVFLKSYSLNYSRLYGYGIPAYADNSGKDPVGYIDGITVEGPGTFRIHGWTLDEDEQGTSLPVHIYLGGGPGDPNAEGYSLVANLPRDDVAAVYPWAGNAHGFDTVIRTGKSGRQVVYAYGINAGRGSNALLGGSGTIIDIPADTENPVISDVRISNLTSTGYTVTCTVSDNVAIRNVVMPTWTEAWGQDDIFWGEATLFGNQATFNVSYSSHNFEYGAYNTHIYANDLAGNSTLYPLIIDVPSALAEEPTSGTVAENTYFIASGMNKNFVLDVENWSQDDFANVQLYYTLGSSANQRWRISDPDGDGYYTIICENSGKSLDAAWGGTTDGTNVQQCESNGTDAQLWKLEDVGSGLYRIVNKNSGLVLDLTAGAVAAGQNIQLYSANDTWAQLWYLIPADLSGPEITDVTFSEISSGGFRVTCTVSDISGIQKVDIPVWSYQNGQDDTIWHSATVEGNTATCYISIADHNYEPGAYDVHIYAYDNAGNPNVVSTNGGLTVPNRIGKAPVTGQLEGGTYFITSAQNQNFVVDVSAALTDNGANIQLWETLGLNRNQMWQISDEDGDGYYTVTAVHSGKAMDIEGGNPASGTNVQQWDVNNSDAQLWQILANEDGTYTFIAKCGGMALDLSYGWIGNGVNIRIHEPNGSVAQKWYLIPADVAGPEITDVTFSEISSEGFRVTCTVSDEAGIQKVEFPSWTKYNGQEDMIWHQATVTGNTATCYISIGDHNLEPGDYELHIYAYDNIGNCGAVVTGGVTVPNRIGQEPVNGQLKNGTYFITCAQNRNYVADVEGISSESGANIYLWETAGDNRNQMWQINDADGDGYYTVVSVNSGKYMDVAGGVAASGTNVQQWDVNNSDAQLWQILANEDGTYTFIAKCGGMALDLSYGWIGNGVNIRIHEPNGSVAQKWYLIPATVPADTDHIHTYLNPVVTEPNCTASGYTTHTCVNCGHSYVSDPVEANGEHSYLDGVCRFCGETETVVVPELNLSYPALDFEDTVYYNIYYTVSDMKSVVEMGLITFDTKLTDGTVSDAKEVISGYVASGDQYKVHSNGICAKNLGDDLFFRVYAKLSDGSYVYSRTESYNAVSYAQSILTHSTDVQIKSLVVAMLNYGAAAQVQFNYKTDTLMNSILSDSQKALVTSYRAGMVTPVQPANSGKVGSFALVDGGYASRYPSVSFDGAFSVNYYFTPAHAMDGDLTMYYWTTQDYAKADVLTHENATGVFKMEEKNGAYAASVEGIAACRIDETIYVAGIYESDGIAYPTGVLAYSLGEYCLYHIANSTGNTNALAKATAIYGYYAKLYFGSW